MRLMGRCATCVIRSLAPGLVFAFSTTHYTDSTDNQDDIGHGAPANQYLRRIQGRVALSVLPPRGHAGVVDDEASLQRSYRPGLMGLLLKGEKLTK
jgi:hypothetical protein